MEGGRGRLERIVEDERRFAVPSPKAIDRLSDAGKLDQAFLEPSFSWEVDEHQANQNGQQPLARDPRQGKEQAERDDPDAGDIFQQMEGQSRDRMVINPQLAILPVQEIGRGQTDQEDHDDQQADAQHEHIHSDRGERIHDELEPGVHISL